jgi:hypothetical protein
MTLCCIKNLAKHIILALTYDRALKMFNTLLIRCNGEVSMSNYPFIFMFKFHVSVIKCILSINKVFSGFKLQVGIFNSGNSTF